MKRNTKFLLLLLLIFFSMLNVHSQSESIKQQTSHSTPYEERLRALLKKFLMDIGFDYQTAQRASVDLNYANSIETQVRQKMERNSLNSIGLWNQLQSDREDAKKLMNADEKEKDRLESLKKARVKQDSNQQEEYQQSDAFHLKTIIHNKYVKWSAKGEFEKTNDYQTRMANKQSAVRDIIISSVQIYTQFMNTIGTSNGDMFKFSCYVGDYNVDNESLELTFKNNKGIELKGVMKLSPDKAKKIKSSLRSTNSDGITKYYTDALIATQDKCSLGFYNNNIMSSKIGVKLRINGINGEKRFEYPEVKIITTIKMDLGEHFFTSTNLGIDMQGNETFNFKDINLACGTMENQQ